MVGSCRKLQEAGRTEITCPTALAVCNNNVTWDAYLGYKAFNKNAFEVAFLAGSNRLVGSRYIR